MSCWNRLSPEYSPVKKILLALPYEGSDWQPILNDVLKCYGAIVESLLAHDPGIEVVVLAKTTALAVHWQQSLKLGEVQCSRLHILDSIDYNDTWIRDYGPLTFISGDRLEYRSFTFNGWGKKYEAGLDNSVSEALQEVLGGRVAKYPMVLEGGALEINHDGVLLVNSNCIIDQNRGTQISLPAMEEKLMQLVGARKVAWIHDIALTGDDTDGHIDTVARFIEDRTLVACGENPEHPDAKQLVHLNEQLRQLCAEHSWRLITLPVPLVRSSVDGRLLPATYANFLICNGVLFVPVYGVNEDESVVKLLEETVPQYRVVTVNCAALLEQHGSLHCATMQVG